MSICIMASLGVQSTVDGFGESSNSPTALNVHHGHQAARGSRSDPMFAFTMATISFFCGGSPFRKPSVQKQLYCHYTLCTTNLYDLNGWLVVNLGQPGRNIRRVFLLMVGRNWNT